MLVRLFRRGQVSFADGDRNLPNERVLGTSERVPTQLFNGYGAQVASLYTGMDLKKNY